MLTLPGLIDIHTHLREPGALHKEDFGSGTRAAAAGGFTAVCCMPNTRPPLVDDAALQLAEQGAQDKTICDYGIHLGAGADNITTAPALAPRTTGLKLYLDATFGPLLIKDLTVLRAHLATWPRTRMILAHAEEYTLGALLACAHLENRPVHICHVSRRSEIELIRDAKMKGWQVTCEVAPHHLCLSTGDILRIGAKRAEVRPVLATPDDQAALWANLDSIDCIATDHAPHLLSEKDSDGVPGFAGLETSLPLMITAIHAGKLTIDQLIDKMAIAPRRILGLPLPDPADTYVEVDENQQYTITNEATISRCGWTPFAGMTVTGQVRRTILRGQVIYDAGQIGDARFPAPPGFGHNLAGQIG